MRYKFYNDLIFTSGESPVVLPIYSDFQEPVSTLIICDGPGPIVVEASFRSGQAGFGDPVLLDKGGTVDFTKDQDIDEIRISLTDPDRQSSYAVFASPSLEVTFARNPVVQPTSDCRISNCNDFRSVVQDYEAPSVNDTKISYLVPPDNDLYIQEWNVSASDGARNIFEIQNDGVGLDSIGNGRMGDGGGQRLYPDSNPLGPIAAGSTVTVVRVEGDINKDWSTGFVGYLEQTT